MPPHLVPWVKRLCTRWLTWWRTDAARPDAEALLDRLRADLDLSALAARFRQWHSDGASTPSIHALLDRLQADAAWPRLSRCLERVAGDQDWKRLRALVHKLHPDVELPEVPVSLSSQHRQALRGLLVLGVLLHANPAPLRHSSSASGSINPAIAQVHVSEALAEVGSVDGRTFGLGGRSGLGPTFDSPERLSSGCAAGSAEPTLPALLPCGMAPAHGRAARVALHIADRPPARAPPASLYLG